MNKINNGEATTIWHGVTHAYLLRRCEDATTEEAEAMSFAASLMVAGECTEEEFCAAERALNSVEKRLCEAWEHDHGEPQRNRHGQILGGHHPALRPELYEEALRNLARQKNGR